MHPDLVAPGYSYAKDLAYREDYVFGLGLCNQVDTEAEHICI